MRRAKARRPQRARRVRRVQAPEPWEIVELAAELGAHAETSPRLTGGDVDADWKSAWGAGDEAVGGSAATPDQDVVDELGEALGLAQASDAELRTSSEILAERDRRRWQLEREALREEP